MAASIESIGQGTTFGWGATNARMGEVSGLRLVGESRTVATPDNESGFYKLMGYQILEAAERGSEWVVAGFPGLVSDDGRYIGPMENIAGLRQRSDMISGLRKQDTKLNQLLLGEFPVIAVNDGELAAQAVAHMIGRGSRKSAAAFIIGTGVGAGFVLQDEKLPHVYRAMRTHAAEIGHIPLSTDLGDTLERSLQGSAFERETGLSPEFIPADHPIWKEKALLIRQGIVVMGTMLSPELVVPTGGVGAGASGKYKAHLLEAMREINLRDDLPEPQKELKPAIEFVDPDTAHEFELHGGPGVMLDFATR